MPRSAYKKASLQRYATVKFFNHGSGGDEILREMIDFTATCPHTSIPEEEVETMTVLVEKAKAYALEQTEMLKAGKKPDMRQPAWADDFIKLKAQQEKSCKSECCVKCSECGVDTPLDQMVVEKVEKVEKSANRPIELVREFTKTPLGQRFDRRYEVLRMMTRGFDIDRGD